ncbi:MAG: hypothetical protein IAX21_00640 [Candidatus Bathyarchaeota archaeon]|nr:MAG: hypothetical protein IAX21_00640 [Candidatus Bathyarchaeota archaeon]
MTDSLAGCLGSYGHPTKPNICFECNNQELCKKSTKDNKINKKYGKSPIQRNWNRLSELSYKHRLHSLEKIEFDYRIAVQNDYASSGKMPDNFMEPSYCINKVRGK